MNKRQFLKTGASRDTHIYKVASGVKHELITVPGGAHGLDNAKPEEKEQFTKRAVEWVHSHMGECEHH